MIWLLLSISAHAMPNPPQPLEPLGFCRLGYYWVKALGECRKVHEEPEIICWRRGQILDCSAEYGGDRWR